MKAREVKRLDAILRSHVYAHFGESLSGLTTIRAYEKQEQFCRVNEESLDVMNRAYFLTIVNQRWLGIRLDLVGDGLIFVVALLVVSSRFSVSPSISGLVLAYCIQVVSSMGYMTRQWAEVENNMNATERLHYYAASIENEAPWDISDHKPLAAWPESGEIVIKDAFMKYRDGLPNVLKGLSLHIRGGERIGIGLILLETSNEQLDGRELVNRLLWLHCSVWWSFPADLSLLTVSTSVELDSMTYELRLRLFLKIQFCFKEQFALI